MVICVFGSLPLVLCGVAFASIGSSESPSQVTLTMGGLDLF